jgi:hypothetical protein
MILWRLCANGCTGIQGFMEGGHRGLEVVGEVEEGSIRLRSPAAPEGGVEEKGRVTPFRMTGVMDELWTTGAG